MLSMVCKFLRGGCNLNDLLFTYCCCPVTNRTEYLFKRFRDFKLLCADVVKESENFIKIIYKNKHKSAKM